MKTVTITDIKRLGAKALKKDGPVYVIVNSRPLSVMLPVEQYELLMRTLEYLEKKSEDEQIERERNMPMEEIAGEEEGWETVIDFTKYTGGAGIPAKDLSAMLDRINRSNNKS